MDLFNFMICAAETKTGFLSNMGEQLPMTLLIVVAVVFMYFGVIRPQSKRKKEMENMMKNMKKGDKVITIGGAHGKVVKTTDTTVTIKVDDSAEITFDKSAIARVVDPQEANKSLEKNGKKDADKGKEKSEDDKIETKTE